MLGYESRSANGGTNPTVREGSNILTVIRKAALPDSRASAATVRDIN
jgi:hypothetical protein